MASKVKKIWCANKNCGRGPSYMGLEPMYAIPFAEENEDSKYHFFCGDCFKEILAKFSVIITRDLMNLLTHVSGEQEYFDFMVSYIKKKRR